MCESPVISYRNLAVLLSHNAWVGSKRNYAAFGANARNHDVIAKFSSGVKCAKSAHLRKRRLHAQVCIVLSTVKRSGRALTVKTFAWARPHLDTPRHTSCWFRAFAQTTPARTHFLYLVRNSMRKRAKCAYTQIREIFKRIKHLRAKHAKSRSRSNYAKFLNRANLYYPPMPV